MKKNENVTINLTKDNNKNKLVAFLLAFFFGVFGIHRFYLNKVISGVIQLFFGIILIWTPLIVICYMFVIIDIIRILFDKNFMLKPNYNDNTNIFVNLTVLNKNNQSEPSIKELNDNDVSVKNSNNTTKN